MRDIRPGAGIVQVTAQGTVADLGEIGGEPDVPPFVGVEDRDPPALPPPVGALIGRSRIREARAEQARQPGRVGDAERIANVEPDENFA